MTDNDPTSAATAPTSAPASASTQASARELTAKQRAILDAALETFAERGYAGSATSEIAKRAGVAEATIFKTWKTKKDLLIAVVAPVFFKIVAPRLIGEVQQILEQTYPDLESFLRALVTNRLLFLREHQQLLRILLQEAPFHPEVRRLAEDAIRTRFWPTFERALLRLQQQGKIVGAPPATILRTIVSVLLGWGLTRYVFAPDHNWDDKREEEQILRLLLDGLSPRAG